MTLKTAFAALALTLASSSALAETIEEKACQEVSDGTKSFGFCVAALGKDAACADVKPSEYRPFCKAMVKGTSGCSDIKDAWKPACEAVGRKSPQECARVADKDAKNLCQAIMLKRTTYCTSIRDADMKRRCGKIMAGIASASEAMPALGEAVLADITIETVMADYARWRPVMEAAVMADVTDYLFDRTQSTKGDADMVSDHAGLLGDLPIPDSVATVRADAAAGRAVSWAAVDKTVLKEASSAVLRIRENLRAHTYVGAHMSDFAR